MAQYKKRPSPKTFEERLLRWAYVMGAEIEEAWDFVEWVQKNIETQSNPSDPSNLINSWAEFQGQYELQAMI